MATGSDRQAVLDAAKYLRGVRPLDPEELSQYVEGGIHPAVAARVLQENAVELGVVERTDGTFVPVPEDPVRPGLGTVRRLPDRYVDRVEESLLEEYGPDWHRGATGDRLRERIRRLKEDYYRNRDVEYDREVALGYAIYHLADFYAAVQYVLETLTGGGLLDRRLRVLDVGAGVGGPALGVHDYLYGPPDPGGTDASTTADPTPATDRDRDPAAALVEYHAVEPGSGAEVLSSLLEATSPNFRPTVHRTTAEAFDPGSVLPETDREGGSGDPTGEDSGGYDLILFANVLSELDDPEAVAGRYFEHLAPDGTLVATAPADRETSVGLRAVERSLEDEGATVFAPEVRLWPDHVPGDEGWSFAERPPVSAPSVQRKLDDGTGEFVKTAVRYSYSALRADDRRRFDVELDPGRRARLADSDDHVTDRVDLVATKLSGNLSDGENPLFRVGDGSQRVDHYAVLVRETALNRALARADYGDPLAFEGALVLYNDDERAYNLVVDEETVVDRVPV